MDLHRDSALVFFDPLVAVVSAGAFDLVRRTLEMQRSMEGFVRETGTAGLPEASVRIGIHTGEVIVGNTETKSGLRLMNRGAPCKSCGSDSAHST